MPKLSDPVYSKEAKKVIQGLHVHLDQEIARGQKFADLVYTTCNYGKWLTKQAMEREANMGEFIYAVFENLVSHALFQNEALPSASPDMTKLGTDEECD